MTDSPDSSLGQTPPRAGFRATLQQSGKTATGFVVPPDVVASLGTSKRPPVRVTIRGHTYRSSIALLGGRFLLPVSAEQRASAGVQAGDDVDVDVELDTSPRQVEVPPDFAAALGEDPGARDFFETLSYSQQRWFVDGINSARAPETRQRRIRAAVDRLHDHRGQR